MLFSSEGAPASKRESCVTRLSSQSTGRCRRAGFARPCAGAVAEGAWEMPRRRHHASLQPVPRSPKVRGAQSVLGTRPRYAVHPHRRRRTRTRCARARRGQFRAGKRQTRLGANRLLVVARGSAGRSHAQVSASFAVFCDGRRTPRLRVLSLLRLCSDML